MLFLSRISAEATARCIAAIAALCLLTAPGFVRAEEDETFKLAPNNPDVVAVFQTAEFFDCPAFKKVATEFPDLAKKLREPLGKNTKLTPRDIESIFVAANTANQEFVVVLNLADEFKLDDVIGEERRTRQEKIGEYTLYVIEDDNAMCLVDESTIAIGPRKTLSAVLKRDDVAEISDELNAAWDDVDDEEHLYVVATLDALAAQAADMIPPGIPLTPETLKKLTSATLTAKAGQRQITFSANLNCTDNMTADQLRSLFNVVVQGSLQPGAKTPDEARRALSTVKSSVEDETITISFNLGLDVILNQLKSQLAAAATTP